MANELKFQIGAFCGAHGRNPVRHLRQAQLMVAFWLGPQHILGAPDDYLGHANLHRYIERIRSALISMSRDLRCLLGAQIRLLRFGRQKRAM